MSALEKPTTWSEDPARKSGPAVLQGCGPGDGRRVPDRPRGCAHRAGTGRRSEQQDGGPRGHARAEARARGLGAGDTGAGARGGRGGSDLCSLQVLACALGVGGTAPTPTAALQGTAREHGLSWWWPRSGAPTAEHGLCLERDRGGGRAPARPSSGELGVRPLLCEVDRTRSPAEVAAKAPRRGRLCDGDVQTDGRRKPGPPQTPQPLRR